LKRRKEKGQQGKIGSGIKQEKKKLRETPPVEVLFKGSSPQEVGGGAGKAQRGCSAIGRGWWRKRRSWDNNTRWGNFIISRRERGRGEMRQEERVLPKGIQSASLVKKNGRTAHSRERVYTG